MKMKIGRRAGLLAAAAAVAFGTVQLTSAQATIEWHDRGISKNECDNGRFCLWRNANFDISDQSYSKFNTIESDQRIWDLGKLQKRGAIWWGINDAVSSAWNRTGGPICLYSDKDSGGAVMRIGPGEEWPNLPSWINDKASSADRC
jgi:hypothetical protein